MQLYVEQGGQAEEASFQAGDWTIFPPGWPGPGISFGVVQSVGAKTSLVYDVFFGMNIEFRNDLVEALTQARRGEMTPAEQSAFVKAQRQFSGGAAAEEERKAA
ncbi:hypothetical protein EON82_18195 [bacterium]|nr:MAG: hypothetical protein EON82_18195 [bacterium]